MLPLVILGPLAGVFVDRWPIKATMVASDLLRAVLAVLLMFSTELWHFYLVLALISTVSSFFGPAQAVTIRTHVPVNGLMSANALMQIGFMSARIAGPIVAGTLVSLLGPSSCYALDVLSFVASASLIGTVAIHRPLDSARGRPADGDRPTSQVSAILGDRTFLVHALRARRRTFVTLTRRTASQRQAGAFPHPVRKPQKPLESDRRNRRAACRNRRQRLP